MQQATKRAQDIFLSIMALAVICAIVWFTYSKYQERNHPVTPLPQANAENAASLPTLDCHGNLCVTPKGQEIANNLLMVPPAKFDDFHKSAINEVPDKGCDYSANKGKPGQLKSVPCTVTYDMVQRSKGKRENFTPNNDPAGWGHNHKVKVAGGPATWFYNRSHLVADSLGGKAIYENVITGTRLQNVGDGKGGMWGVENSVKEYIEDHPDCSVAYTVTPLYTNEFQKLPVATRIDAKSCDGSLNIEAFVPNVFPGFAIDYSTGEFYRESDVHAMIYGK